MIRINKTKKFLIENALVQGQNVPKIVYSNLFFDFDRWSNHFVYIFFFI